MTNFPSRFPETTTPRPTDAPALRWGIIAPGWIASRFVASLKSNTTQKVVAVGSRSVERATEFASEFDIERAYSSYQHVFDDPDIDAVYIATLQSEHRTVALAAIAAGKHVLIEKPFTVTAAEASEVIAAARAQGVFAMEAMWARYLPQGEIIRRLLDDGVLGEIKLVCADHGQRLDEEKRLFDPSLGGGALLDLGIYPVSFASSVLGKPKSISAIGTVTDSGVDAQSVLTLGYDNGAQADLSTSLVSTTPVSAWVSGRDALLRVEAPFMFPTGLTLSDPELGGQSISWADSSGLTGFDGLSHEAAAFARFVDAGFVESPVHPHSEVVEILEVIDEARRQLGVVIPDQR